MSTVREIAKQAGVSATTVSRVLNNHPRVSDEARDRVLMIVNEQRYVANVGRRSTSNLGLVYSGGANLYSPYDMAILAGIQEAMDDTGLDLMIVDARKARRRDETYTQMLVRKGIRGAVLRVTEASRDVAESIADERFPCVVVGDRFAGGSVHYVDSNSRPASREAVEHLIDLGHRRIAIASHHIDDTDHADRILGYREALERGGIDYDERLIFRAPAGIESGASLLQRLMSMPDRPTALFVLDPDTSIGVMTEAQRHGIRVPDQLSVVGFDDARTRLFTYPRLTAVCQDASAIGRSALQMLRQVIVDRPQSPVHEEMRTWLEVNGTTGPAPA